MILSFGVRALPARGDCVAGSRRVCLLCVVRASGVLWRVYHGLVVRRMPTGVFGGFTRVLVLARWVHVQVPAVRAGDF